MTVTRKRRILATIVAVSCVAVPASAAADSLPETYRSDAAQSGSPSTSTDRSDAAQAGWDVRRAAVAATDRSDAAQAGWDAREPAVANVAFPPADFRGADSPVDHPGATRAEPAPTTVEVVQPERTIVRDVDEVLPLILSSTALLLVLAGIGFTLVRTRMVPGRTH
jgi:hypothetical protein